MKILLIAPPEINIFNFSRMREGTLRYPPLGLLYIASYMKKYANHEISVIDACLLNNNYQELEQRIKIINPDLVGIQATTPSLKDAVLTARLIKKINPEIHVNIGGPHTSVYPKETLSFPEVDSIAIGEGEITFTELANALAQMNGLETIKGLAFKKSGQSIFNDPRESIQNLDDLPFPSRDMLPFTKYHSAVGKKPFAATIITSRGCPYNCLFCSTKKGIFRERSPKNVIQELRECIAMGFTEFEFFDDTFTVNPKRVMDICDLIIEENLKMVWTIRARINTVNCEVLNKLKQAGCIRINYGVETGTPEILRLIRKGITIEQTKEVFSMTRKLGIMTMAYFMIGHPTETKQQILQSIEFAKSLKADYCQFAIATPLPGTDMYEMAFETKLYTEDHWLKFAQNPFAPFRPKVWTENLSEKELFDLLEFAYKKFYLTPSYIIKNLFSIRSLSELKQNINVALKIINFQKKRLY